MTGLPPATWIRAREETRLLHVAATAGSFTDHRIDDLPALVAPEDLLVFNDAATLPASLPGRRASGEELELRLLEAPSDEGLAWSVSYRQGSWRTRTEDREGPESLSLGARIRIGDTTLEAEVVERSASSSRLVLLHFDAELSETLDVIYRVGRPVQYSYLSAELPLWAIQTPFAQRPWAVEPPSAGLAFCFELIRSLEARGAEFACLTHGAGLSSTGDSAIDLRLPLSERFEIPEVTVAKIAAAKARGGRVIAVGTTVARALEGAVRRGHGRLVSGRGRTSLRIGPDTRFQVVDGLLTGMHLPGESHYEILRALAPSSLLEAAHEHARTAGYLAHELGDCTLVLG